MVTTPEEVAMMDVRKELNFCVKTKLPVLGVIENMSQFQLKVRDLSFFRDGRNDDGCQVDCTNDVLDLLNNKCPEVLSMLASAKVFPPTGSGPRGMAEKFQVPFLGSLPLDPKLLQSCEQGIAFVQHFPDSAAAMAINAITDQIVEALPVENDEDVE